LLCFEPSFHISGSVSQTAAISQFIAFAFGFAAIYFVVIEFQDAFVVYKLHGTGWTIIEAQLHLVSGTGVLDIVSANDCISLSPLVFIHDVIQSGLHAVYVSCLQDFGDFCLNGALKYFYRRRRIIKDDDDYLREELHELPKQGFNVDVYYGWGFAWFVASVILDLYAAVLLPILRSHISVGVIKWWHEPEKKEKKEKEKKEKKEKKSLKKSKSKKTL
jgi:hypothetical protein